MRLHCFERCPGQREHTNGGQKWLKLAFITLYYLLLHWRCLITEHDIEPFQISQIKDLKNGRKNSQLHEIA